jgi:hypothetical protein
MKRDQLPMKISHSMRDSGVGITTLEMHGKVDFLQITEGLNAAGRAPSSRGRLGDDEQGGAPYPAAGAKVHYRGNRGDERPEKFRGHR